MNVTVLKALVALAPACILFSGSAVLFFRAKSVRSFLQLLGAGFLVISRSHSYLRGPSFVFVDAVGT